MNNALLFVGLTFIVAMACALSDPIPGCHQPPHPPKNWVWPTGVLVTLAAVPVTDGVAIPTEREYCALRYRNVQIKAGGEILTAIEPQSDDVSEALTKISNAIEHKILLPFVLAQSFLAIINPPADPSRPQRLYSRRLR